MSTWTDAMVESRRQIAWGRYLAGLAAKPRDDAGDRISFKKRRRAERKAVFAGLHAGKRFSGTVVRLCPAGVCVDIGGCVTGLSRFAGMDAAGREFAQSLGRGAPAVVEVLSVKDGSVELRIVSAGRMEAHEDG